jgi:hypothetical protein
MRPRVRRTYDEGSFYRVITEFAHFKNCHGRESRILLFAQSEARLLESRAGREAPREATDRLAASFGADLVTPITAFRHFMC